MNQLNNAFTLWMSLMVEAMPFLLLGVLLSSLLLLFVDERKLIAILPRHPLLGALAGSLIGFLFPVCECGNIPVARRLLLQGVPSSVSIGFLLAAPTINPIVIWSTWVAFRDQPEVVLWRVLFSLAIATTIGWIFSFQKDLRPLLQPSVLRAMPQSAPEPTPEAKKAQSISPLLQSGTFLLGQGEQPMRLDTTAVQTTPLPQLGNAQIGLFRFSGVDRWRIRLFVENTLQELRELGGILVVGSAIAAIVQVSIPRDIILSLGQGPVSSILAMLAFASVVSICSTVDAFLALSFASSFTTGSLLAFLVFGPTIDLKALGLLLSIFKGRAVVYLMALTAQLTFLFTLIYNLKVG
ncbi:permease [Oxynema sp. CENA135]|uniref:permease n=1 Tax=Oxynema sp. CENA135 TaxID=984206 RepID=UPI00190BC9A4|nr:permease [Oxynema sp. CENA135]MBK4732023.1 permease [Oxynema sp. CENA135]